MSQCTSHKKSFEICRWRLEEQQGYWKTHSHLRFIVAGSVKSEDVDTNDHSASIKHLNQLTNEREGAGEDEKHAVAVHGECDGKVSSQAAPYEKLIHCRPVMGVQTQLKNRILSEN